MYTCLMNTEAISTLWGKPLLYNYASNHSLEELDKDIWVQESDTVG